MAHLALFPEGRLSSNSWSENPGAGHIKRNRFRYSYGRQANRTLATLPVPAITDIPEWVGKVDLDQIVGADASLITTPPPAVTLKSWQAFRYDKLFDIKKGQRLTKGNMAEGDTPFIGAIESDNGYRQYVSASPNHEAGTITVSYNGSVGEAFYQSAPFWASDDINVLYPKFDMNVFVAMFLCALIRREKFRFSYGRKWHLGRMNESLIRLPCDTAGVPDWAFMETYIKSLPYSTSIAA